MQVQELSLSRDDLVPDDNLEMITKHVIPYTRHLLLKSNGYHQVETWMMKYTLGRCSNKLKELTLDFDISEDEDEDDNGFDQEQEIPWNLEQLNLLNYDYKLHSEAFCLWLWKQCGQVKRLRIDGLDGIAQSLAEGMWAHMPNLCEIHLGSQWLDASDDNLAMILSRARHGWKVVKLGSIENFGDATRQALSKHFSILETLLVDRTDGFRSHDMVQVLSSTTKLCTLIDNFANSHGNLDSRRCNANVFIDRDSSTGLLNTWLCENSLRNFSVNIRGIPRPDLEGRGVVEETYPGQGREIQKQVYDRLGRLTKLESLQLGYTHPVGSKLTNKAIQMDCLEMSLESGLWKLKGLKSLKKLDVAHMAVRIGVREVQWMVEQWPRLHTICGLDSDEERVVKAVRWLRENHPEIELDAA